MSAPAMARLVTDIAAGFMTLLQTEIRYSIARAPGAISLWLLKLPLYILLWISFSVMLGWLTYELFGQAWTGFVACFLLQCAALLLMNRKLGSLQHAMSLPVTRQLLKDYQQLFREAQVEPGESQ